MTADSFEISASAKHATAPAYHPAARRRPAPASRKRSQHTRAATPKRNCSVSLQAENHMMASWCPSYTAKKTAAQAASR